MRGIFNSEVNLILRPHNWFQIGSLNSEAHIRMDSGISVNAIRF
jgi:hypothetical protein